MVGFVPQRSSVPFYPIPTPGYLLAIAFRNGAVTVLARSRLAVVAGTVSWLLWTRLGRLNGTASGVTVVPLASGTAVVRLVAIGYGVRPLALPVETAVRTCTPCGCETHHELITRSNQYPVDIGIALVVDAMALASPSPRIADGRDKDRS